RLRRSGRRLPCQRYVLHTADVHDRVQLHRSRWLRRHDLVPDLRAAMKGSSMDRAMEPPHRSSLAPAKPGGVVRRTRLARPAWLLTAFVAACGGGSPSPEGEHPMPDATTDDAPSPVMDALPPPAEADAIVTAQAICASSGWCWDLPQPQGN